MSNSKDIPIFPNTQAQDCNYAGFYNELVRRMLVREPVSGDATQPEKGGRHEVEQSGDTEIACRKRARPSGHPVEPDDDLVEVRVGEHAADSEALGCIGALAMVVEWMCVRSLPGRQPPLSIT